MSNQLQCIDKIQKINQSEWLLPQNLFFSNIEIWLKTKKNFISCPLRTTKIIDKMQISWLFLTSFVFNFYAQRLGITPFLFSNFNVGFEEVTLEKIEKLTNLFKNKIIQSYKIAVLCKQNLVPIYINVVIRISDTKNHAMALCILPTIPKWTILFIDTSMSSDKKENKIMRELLEESIKKLKKELNQSPLFLKLLKESERKETSIDFSLQFWHKDLQKHTSTCLSFSSYFAFQIILKGPSFWQELYNNGKTQANSLQDWILRFEKTNDIINESVIDYLYMMQHNLVELLFYYVVDPSLEAWEKEVEKEAKKKNLPFRPISYLEKQKTLDEKSENFQYLQIYWQEEDELINYIDKTLNNLKNSGDLPLLEHLSRFMVLLLDSDLNFFNIVPLSTTHEIDENGKKRLERYVKLYRLVHRSPQIAKNLKFDHELDNLGQQLIQFPFIHSPSIDQFKEDQPIQLKELKHIMNLILLAQIKIINARKGKKQLIKNILKKMETIRKTIDDSTDLDQLKQIFLTLKKIEHTEMVHGY